MALLECVANLSEGRDPTVITALSDSIKSVPEVTLHHVDTGFAANRTVFTFTGAPHPLMESVFRLYQAAFKYIDMALHKGTHPRMGAVDVCPLVPLRGVSIAETNVMIGELGKRLADDVGIGGYYYALTASDPQRRELSYLRKGQYESLPDKLDSLPLDFGSNQHWQKFGVSVLGCRQLLLAYNVNLSTRNPQKAHQIAQRVRESGWLQKDEDGTLQRVYGRLKSVKGLGWFIKDFNLAQASYNLTDLSANGLLEVFNATREVATEFGVSVTGSELIGLTPLAELRKVARFVRPEQAMDLPEIISTAVNYLGLNSVKGFDPYQQVLDLKLGEEIA